MARKPARLGALIERLDELVDAFQAHADPTVREGVPELVAGLQALHTLGLARLLTLLSEDRERYDRALADPLIANLLLLHDLITLDERRLAEEVLRSFEPRAQVEGGSIELQGVQEGVVRVRLPGAATGLQGELEEALADGLPGFQRLEVEGQATCAAAALRHWPEIVAFQGEGTASLVPTDKARALERRRQEEETRRQVRGGHEVQSPRRLKIGKLDEIAQRTLRPALIHGYPVLLVRLDANVRAFRNACPGSMLPLHAGSLDDRMIVCPWHGCRFDAASGARAGGESGPPLERLTVIIEDGAVWLEAP